MWTEPMLLARAKLRRERRKWYVLMDKVIHPRNIRAAWERVWRNRGASGVDRVSVEAYRRQLDHELGVVERTLRAKTYRPQPVLRVHIPKPGGGVRPLGIPTVRDRVVQAAVLQVMEPIFEDKFRSCSYGFRPGRGAKDALRRVDTTLAERPIVVDADIVGCFDNLSHEAMMGAVVEEIADGSVLDLVEGFLRAGVKCASVLTSTEKGSPQGAVISPLLCNAVLHELDEAMEEAGYCLVRYADDIVVLCRDEAEAERALGALKATLKRIGLEVHPGKTQVVDWRREPFDFLGYRFFNGRRHIRPKSLKKIRQRIREMTPRTWGDSLSVLTKRLNPSLRGVFEFFKHAHPTALRGVDGYVRQRLRSILRKQAGRSGRARGLDHRRYPNAYFLALGLFSLESARQSLVASRQRSPCGAT
jgi:RNA-directed DNA polymerase